MENKLNLSDDFSRREFVEKLAYSLLGVTALSQTTFADDIPSTHFGKAKRMIIISLNGGASHIDTFDPKDNPNVNGGVNPIPTTGGFTISKYFPQLAQHGNKFSVIRGMTTKSGAHEPASYIMKTSFMKNSLTVHPSVASIIYALKGAQHGTIPDNILITPDSNHPKAGYLDKKFSPLIIVNPLEGLRYSKISVDNAKFSKRLEILKAFDDNFQNKYENEATKEYSIIYNETLKLLSSKDLDLFDLNKEDAATRERYGKSSFGSGVLLAKRLIKNGVRAVEVGSSSWDFHNDIQTAMENKSKDVDQALAALFDDLSKEGLLKDTLVVVTTEFGRTGSYSKDGKALTDANNANPYNVNSGRDHQATAFSCMIGGMDIAGKVIGKTNDLGNKVIERPVSVGEFNATVGHLFGIKHDYVWHSPTNRPFTIGNKEKPIIELIS